MVVLYKIKPAAGDDIAFCWVVVIFGGNNPFEVDTICNIALASFGLTPIPTALLPPSVRNRLAKLLPFTRKSISILPVFASMQNAGVPAALSSLPIRKHSTDVLFTSALKSISPLCAFPADVTSDARATIDAYSFAFGGPASSSP